MARNVKLVAVFGGEGTQTPAMRGYAILEKYLAPLIHVLQDVYSNEGLKGKGNVGINMSFSFPIIDSSEALFARYCKWSPLVIFFKLGAF